MSGSPPAKPRGSSSQSALSFASTKLRAPQKRNIATASGASSAAKRARREAGLREDALLLALKQRFGFEAFKPGQRRVVEAVLAGRNACAIFPTGGGKSLCYQLPALLLPGLTLVVSPLIALMKDQVEQLNRRGHPADMLNSSLDVGERAEVRRRVESGITKLLYVAPEQLINGSTRALVLQREISLVAIDEVHCISEWGHAFRPDYLRLSKFVQKIDARVLGLTATATAEVSNDLCRLFEIDEACCVRTPFHRRALELSFEVCRAEDRNERLLALLRARPLRARPAAEGRAEVEGSPAAAAGSPRGASIVYTTTQRAADDVARLLNRHGLSARAYHAGMAATTRTECQDWFMATDCGVICATIAFGMGIDKRDIRQVVHYNLPKSMEGYVQEIGRAARDGKPARCDMLVCMDDIAPIQSFAYAATPTMSGTRGALEAVFLGDDRRRSPVPAGDVREVKLHRVAKEHDTHQNALKMLLAFVDVYHEHLKTLPPLFEAYKVRPKEGGDFRRVSRALARKLGPGGGRILRVAKTWAHVRDMEAAARSLPHATRTQIVLALTSLEALPASEGGAVVRAAQRVHRYEVLSQPGDLPKLAETLRDKMLERQRTELARLEEVLDFVSAEGCQARRLTERFGPAGETTRCDRGCRFCRVGERLALPERPDRADAERRAEESPNWRRVLRDTGIPKDDPHLLARFVLGFSSPRIVAEKLKKNPLYGCLSASGWEAVIGMCRRAAEGR
jgi:ATP-dependent DNA helicase RecQ